MLLPQSFACDVDIEDLGVATLPASRLGPVSAADITPAVLKQEQQQCTSKTAATAAAAGVQDAIAARQEEQERAFAASLQDVHAGSVLRPGSIPQLVAAMAAARDAHVPVHLLAGNTGAGLYTDQWQRLASHACVLLQGVSELEQVSVQPGWGQQRVVVAGAGATITALIDVLLEAAAAAAACSAGSAPLANGSKGLQAPAAAAAATANGEQQQQHDAANLQAAISHLRRVAGTLVRNAATLGGHMVLARQQHLESDLAPIFLAAGAAASSPAPQAAGHGRRDRGGGAGREGQATSSWRLCRIAVALQQNPLTRTASLAHAAVLRFPCPALPLPALSQVLTCASPRWTPAASGCQWGRCCSVLPTVQMHSTQLRCSSWTAGRPSFLQSGCRCRSAPVTAVSASGRTN